MDGPTVPQKDRRKSATEFKWTSPECARLTPVTPGAYSVVGKGWQGPERLTCYGRRSIRIEFSVLGEENTAISLFCNLGDKETPRFGMGSNYFHWWTAANGGLPERGQAMSPDVFLEGQIFEVYVEDSRLNAKKQEKPDRQIYSHITKLINVHRPSIKSANHSITESGNHGDYESESRIKNQESAINDHPIRHHPIKVGT
jgi:hypothetical protein